MSDVSTVNKIFKFILVCIDIFSRFLYAIPLKDKETRTIINSMEKIFKLAKPEIINCDNGSEFISRSFKKLAENNNIKINYVEVGDHHKLSIIDRVVRTLREKISNYLVMHNTNTYINVLPNLIHSYNNNFYSGIKMIPSEVKDTDETITALMQNMYEKAIQKENKFDVNNSVRYIINFKQFEKHTLQNGQKQFIKLFHVIVIVTFLIMVK